MKFQYLRIFFLLSLLVIATVAFGQDDCTVKLRQAQKLYEEGKIEKIPDLIDNCIESGFNKENKVAALRLLTLVYLYDDNIEKAEESLLRMLKVQPEYQVNHTDDPIEFVRLFSSYNTTSVFSLGIVGGGIITTPRLVQLYTAYDSDKAHPDYSSGGLGFSIGLKAIYHYNKDFDIVFEPKFTLHNFSIYEKVNELSNFYAIEKANYLDFPVLVSYYYYRYRQMSFFADLGLSYSLLMSDKINEPITEYPNGENNDIKGTTLNRMDYRNKYLISGIAGAGVKFHLKRDNIQFNVRYNLGLNNVVNENSLTDYEKSNVNDELLIKHHYMENKYSISNFSFLISYNREFYIHSKKK